MIGDPLVRVTCDSCGYEEEHGLTALARRSWDMRDLENELKHDGWRVEGDITTCEDCVEQEEVDKEEGEKSG